MGHLNHRAINNCGIRGRFPKGFCDLCPCVAETVWKKQNAGGAGTIQGIASAKKCCDHRVAAVGLDHLSAEQEHVRMTACLHYQR